MTIPTELIGLCEANKFMWRRSNPGKVREVFKDLGLREDSQFCQFLQCYVMQFFSNKIDYNMADIIEEDGASDLIDYVHQELQVERNYLPISLYEAESLFAVDTVADAVVYATWDEALDAWKYDTIHPSFYRYMIEVLS